MIILIESIALCLLFTLIIVPVVLKNPLGQIYNYPPAIIERVKELGLITDKQPKGSRSTIIKKVTVSIFFAIILAAFLILINKEKTFLRGFLTSYLLWTIVDWYDAFILDYICFCHSKRIIIPGTEDMEDEYHNYVFHIKESLKEYLYQKTKRNPMILPIIMEV